MEATKTIVKDTLFILPDHGKMNVPIPELHFYKWMVENKIQDPHKIDTKQAYLKAIGFDRERCTLGKDAQKDLDLLNNCIEIYYLWVVKPTIICRFCGTAKDLFWKFEDGGYCCTSYECQHKMKEGTYQAR